MASWRSMTKIAGSGSTSGSIIQRHGSTGPDPHQNVMDPEHCDPSDTLTYLSCFLRNNVEDPHHLWYESGFAWSPWCGSDSWFYLMRIPDSLYPFGTDHVTDLFWWCESGFTLTLWYGSGYWSFLMRIRIRFIPLVRIRLLIFFDANIFLLLNLFFLLQVWRNKETILLLRSTVLLVHDWRSVQAFVSWCTGDTAGSQIYQQRR